MSYRTHGSSLYGFGCCTKLTEVPGTGIYPGKYTHSGEEFDLKWRISSNLHGMFSQANVAEAIRRGCVGNIDNHHRGDKS